MSDGSWASVLGLGLMGSISKEYRNSKMDPDASPQESGREFGQVPHDPAGFGQVWKPQSAARRGTCGPVSVLEPGTVRGGGP